MKTASINLSKIDKTKLITGKSGDKYLSIVIWENEQTDQYGNDFAIQQQLSKEEREAGAKPIYLGNGKDWSKAQNSANNDVKPESSGNTQDYSDLPF